MLKTTIDLQHRQTAQPKMHHPKYTSAVSSRSCSLPEPVKHKGRETRGQRKAGQRFAAHVHSSLGCSGGKTASGDKMGQKDAEDKALLRS